MKAREIETCTPVTKRNSCDRTIHNIPNVQFLRTTSLKLSPRNARTHSKKQVRQIANSIQRFGWTTPVLADENRIIIAGNGRYLAALERGLDRIPVIIVSHLTDAEKRALALADNKIAENAGFDRKILAAELGELATLLPDINLDISITGFEPAEIDALAVDFTDPEQGPADEVPALDSSEAITKTGDLWVLGEHRLLCGDACSDSDFRHLMGRELSAMLFGDPPYNVAWRPSRTREKPGFPGL